MKKEYLIVDIGSKTTDVIYIKNGIPVESKSITIERAMIKWIRQVQGSLQIQYGKNIPESEILKVILKQSSNLPKPYIKHSKKIITEQITELLLELEEREYDLSYTNMIFVGGGAIAVKNYSEYKDNVAYVALTKELSKIQLSYIWRLGNTGQFKNKNIFLFLDEIQNMDSSSKGPLAMMISEGRKMGINLLMATQLMFMNSSSAVQQRISQCSLILFFKPAISHLGQTAKMISSGNEHHWIRTLDDLKVGEFIARGNLMLSNREITYPVKVSAYVETNNNMNDYCVQSCPR